MSFSKEEQEALRLGSEYAAFVKGPIWLRIRGAMEQLVLDSFQDMADCQSSDARVKANLQWRWEQRRVMLQKVEQHIENVINERAEFIKEFYRSQGVPEEAIQENADVFEP